MKRVFTIIATVYTLQAFGQESPDVINQQASLTISPAFQEWSSDGNRLFSEMSSTLLWYQPLMRNASVSLRSSYASSSGNVTPLKSVNDIQLSANYYFERADIVFGLGLNIPSGKKKLTQEEFETSFLISNSLFRLQAPHYGTGLNLSPSVSWAMPLSDRIVVGLGAMYFYRGSFDPVQDLAEYDPADEITFSAGADIRLDAVSTFSLDAVYTKYATDKVKGIEVFSPGEKLFVGARFKRYFGFDELTLTAVTRFRSATESRIGNVLLPNAERVEPNQLECHGAYLLKLSNVVALRIMLEGRFFEESPDPLSGAVLGIVGIGPEFSISDNVRIPVQIRYTSGTIKGDVSLSGIDIGVGITYLY